MRRPGHSSTEAQLAAAADRALAAGPSDDRAALAPEVAEQVRIAARVRALDAAPSDALRHALADLAATAQRGRERRRPIPTRKLRVLTAAVTGAAVVAVFALSGGGTSPTVAQAAALSLRPASAPAPLPQSSDPALLAQVSAGIAYPNLAYRFAWRASGIRTDTLAGRRVSTVLYAGHAGERIGYAIIAGAPLGIPAGHAERRGGVSYVLLHGAAGAIVTWRESGHTCVLTGSGVSPQRLLALASWSAG